MKINWNERKAKALIWIMTAGFGFLYLSLCFNHNVWTDEAYTMRLIKRNFAGIIQGTANDVHPPLYYFIAKLAALLVPTWEHRLFVQKMVTIIPMCLTLGCGGHWILNRKIGGGHTAILYVLTVAFLPCTMEYAVQVRMYSWALFFVTMCGLKAYDAYNRSMKKDWIGFVLWGTAAAYTQYFSLVSVAVICGLLFLTLLFFKRKQLLYWLFSVLSMCVLYLPWIGILFKQFSKVSESYWIPPITGKTILGYVKWAFGTELQFSWQMLFLLFLLAGGCNLCYVIKKRKSEDIFALLCYMVPLFTMLLGVAVSLLRRPIYYDRYVLSALGLLSIFFAITMGRQKKSFQVALLAFFLLTGLETYRETRIQEYHSTYVEETEQFFKENMGENDVVVYNWEIYRIVYTYYFEEDKLFFQDDMDFSADYENIWYLDTFNNWDIDQEVLDAHGLHKAYVGHMGIEHNEFDLYRISHGGAQ